MVAGPDVIGSRFDGRERIRLRGALLVIVGAVGLLLWPIARYSSSTVPVHDIMPSVVAILVTLFFVWASVIAWGLPTLVRAEVRSLTPPWAALATYLAPIPAVMLRMEQPTYDVDVPTMLVEWQRLTGPLDLAVKTLEQFPFWLLAPTLFLLLGVAWARAQWDWFVAGVVGLLVYDTIYTVTTGGTTLDFFLNLFLVAIPGVLLVRPGIYLAADVDTG